MKKILYALFAAALLFAAPAALAAGTTNGFALTGEQTVLNGLFRTTGAFTGRPSMYLGLFTACPNAADGTGGTEVSTTNTAYGRTTLTLADANWYAATGTSPAATKNTGTLTLSWTPSGSALPVTVTCWGIWSAASAGNLLLWGTLTTNKTINAGDAAPTFADSALTITLD